MKTADFSALSRFWPTILLAFIGCVCCKGKTPVAVSTEGTEQVPNNHESPPATPDAISEQERLITLPSCKKCLTSGISFPMGQQTRSFHLYLPATTATKAVMVLHGNGGSADQVAGIGISVSPPKKWLSVAERENFVVIIPNGTPGDGGKLGWNDCRADGAGNPTTNDVAFLSLLAQVISKHYGVSKHFVTGMSNGGHMSLRLATEVPGIFSGAGIISAAVAAKSQCTPANKPVSVLLMRGKADPISPFNGGQMASNRGLVLSMDESLSVFLGWNKIDKTPVSSALPDTNITDNSTITKIAYPPSPTGTRVEGYEVNGGGHVEPSLTEFYGPLYKTIVGEQNRDVECAEVVWNFFKNL